jgi:hypothetical protein
MPIHTVKKSAPQASPQRSAARSHPLFAALGYEPVPFVKQVSCLVRVPLLHLQRHSTPAATMNTGKVIPITDASIFQVVKYPQENAGFRKRPFSETSEVVYGQARESQFAANI